METLPYEYKFMLSNFVPQAQSTKDKHAVERCIKFILLHRHVILRITSCVVERKRLYPDFVEV